MRRVMRGPWLAVGVAVVALGAVVGWWLWANRPVAGSADLHEVLRDRGRLALVGDADLARLVGGQTELVPAEKLPEIRDALRGTSPQRLTRALEEAGVDGLLVDGRNGPPPRGEGAVAPLVGRLRAYHHVEGLRGVYLAPAAGLYLRAAEVALPPRMAEALAVVARGILEGKRPPRLQSFPQPLRQLRTVEVMVMLRDGGKPRLWRSARGSSIASALLTATVVARERWQEREGAMGGPLAAKLSTLEVEVSLLEEDGTLGAHGAGFLNRVITGDHGVGYERKGSWRYVLPERTDRPVAASLDALLRDNGFGPDAKARPDMRLYRLVAKPLAVSPPGAPD
jgi:hypothetical protein